MLGARPVERERVLHRQPTGPNPLNHRDDLSRPALRDGKDACSGRDLPKWGETCLSIRGQDHFTPMREIKRHVRALARNHPEGWKLQGHVSPTTTNYLTHRGTSLMRKRIPLRPYRRPVPRVMRGSSGYKGTSPMRNRAPPRRATIGPSLINNSPPP